MDRGTRRPKEKAESGEVVAFSLFFGEPIIFTDPEGKLGSDEQGQESLGAAAPGPARAGGG